MTTIHFSIPPLPFFILSGIQDVPPGAKHPARRNFGVFDLLVVIEGCIYITEEDRSYEIQAGQSFILRPDAYHYPTQGGLHHTKYYWLHFMTNGDWHYTEESARAPLPTSPDKPSFLPYNEITPFELKIPQFISLLHPEKVYQTIQELTQLSHNVPLDRVRMHQQVLFQQLLQELTDAIQTQPPSPHTVCAERAAAFLRQHYKEEISSQQLGEVLNFHPVYIARCMQKVFGCSPAVYRLRFRIENSKRMLLQTNLPITRISEEVGFNHPAYFTASFVKYEGISPRKYRQRFT
nr:helix-turn-helix domain-containing protein [Paenibacillus shirakamiensis]